MATKTIYWVGSSGDKITLTYSSAEGDQSVLVASDPNTSSSSRNKTITFTPTGGTAQTLSVTQAGSSPLPAGAIPCEMLYTDGYTNFVETGLIPGTSASWKLDYMSVYTTGNSSGSVPFGYMISGKRYTPIRIDTSKRFEVGFDYWYTSSVSINANHRVTQLHCEVVSTQTGTTLEIYENGSILGTATVSYTETDYTPNQTIGILARKTSAAGGENGSFRGGVMRLKYYDDDHFGHLAADFIPCYYNDQFGFWDAVSQSFKTAIDTTKIYGFGDAWNTAGFKPNCRNSSNNNYLNNLIDYRGEVASPMFEIPSGCTQIRFNAGTVASAENYALMFFDSSKNYVGYRNYNTADRLVTIDSGAAYVRMSMGRNLVNNCYIYDATNSQYIWKGISV